MNHDAAFGLDPLQGVECEKFCRNLITVDPSTVGFVPDKLDDGTAASTVLKRSTFGAVFMDGQFGKLPKTHDFSVVWEGQMNCDPPATVRALKPKYWLKGQIRMKADHVYRL